MVEPGGRKVVRRAWSTPWLPCQGGSYWNEVVPGEGRVQKRLTLKSVGERERGALEL
jgi:hypothetical protein